MSLPLSSAILFANFSTVILTSVCLRIPVQPVFLVWWGIDFIILRKLGYSADDLQNHTSGAIQKASGPILTMLSVGAMTGIFAECGIIAQIARTGIRWIKPSVILPGSYLLCFLLAFLTGSAFGAISSGGIICLSIARSLQLPDAYTVSAIITGAFIAYCCSPFSELVPIASSLLNISPGRTWKISARLMAPAFAICIVVYGILNMRIVSSGLPATESLQLSAAQAGVYPLSALSVLTVLLPMSILFLMLFFRLPVPAALLSGALTAGLMGKFFLGKSASELLLAAWSGGATMDQGAALSGGMQSMSGTILLLIVSFGLFGLLDTANILQTVLFPLFRKSGNAVVRQLIMTLSAFLVTAFSASALCSILFLYHFSAPVYDRNGWDKGELIMSGLAGSVALSLIVPWHSNAVTPAAFLGTVPTEHIPMMFFSAVPSLILILSSIINLHSHRNVLNS